MKFICNSSFIFKNLYFEKKEEQFLHDHQECILTY